MTDLLEALKSVGGKVGKGLAIELFLEYYEKDMISQLKDMLDQSGIIAEDIPEIVRENKALPIPQVAFQNMKGLEDYLVTLNPARIFEWLTKARPDLGLALASLDDAGAEYVVRFKSFFIDSIRAAPLKEVPPPTPDSSEEVPEKTVATQLRVTCSECGEAFMTTRQEIDSLKQCPNCGAPANLTG
ncbi:MAG TPA: hypothetical protein VMV84_05735 [Dehalococcoidales bacterium]|nr:hypothetical protein [Dehalococcoidales bacterium]